LPGRRKSPLFLKGSDMLKLSIQDEQTLAKMGIAATPPLNEGLPAYVQACQERDYWHRAADAFSALAERQQGRIADLCRALDREAADTRRQAALALMWRDYAITTWCGVGVAALIGIGIILWTVAR
jgi:hypothetical protein